MSLANTFLKYENLTDNNQKTFEMYKKQLELISLNNHQALIVSGERRKFLIVQTLNNVLLGIMVSIVTICFFLGKKVKII